MLPCYLSAVPMMGLLPPLLLPRSCEGQSTGPGHYEPSMSVGAFVCVGIFLSSADMNLGKQAQELGIVILQP